MGIALGFLGKAYYLGTSTRASWGTTVNGITSGPAPSGLVEMTCVRSASAGNAFAEADGTTRASNGFKLSLPALQEMEADLEIPWNPAATDFIALQKAFLSRSPIAVALLDGDKATVGSQGPWADWAVMDFPREEPEDKEMLCKVKLKPTVSSVAPQWVKVSS